MRSPRLAAAAADVAALSKSLLQCLDDARAPGAVVLWSETGLFTSLPVLYLVCVCVCVCCIHFYSPCVCIVCSSFSIRGSISG